MDHKRESDMSMCNKLSDRTSGLARVLAEAVPRAGDDIAVNDKPVPFTKSSDIWQGDDLELRGVDFVGSEASSFPKLSVYVFKNTGPF